VTSPDDSLTAPRAARPATVLPGRGGLPKAVLTALDGDRAEVYLHGAHVTSWVPAGGVERLFLAAGGAMALTLLLGALSRAMREEGVNEAITLT